MKSYQKNDTVDLDPKVCPGWTQGRIVSIAGTFAKVKTAGIQRSKSSAKAITFDVTFAQLRAWDKGGMEGDTGEGKGGVR